MKRRNALACVGLLPLLLTGCASTPTATHWYELKSAPPEAVPAPGADDGSVWELSALVRLPGALDRDTLVVASGAAGVTPLSGHRWVEPLRASIPARLADDLARLRGAGRAWLSPAPAGVRVTQRLRVEIDTLVADEARTVLRLRARWWLSEVAPTGSPASGTAVIDIRLPDPSVDTLAAAHRLAIWRLARQIEAPP
ncbi:MAG: PqiC family protein [Hydrogenophaga sp.]|uniref:PqiC family protein n=1 Tax=Hydrogenophaga sp. TaxID=1904254 RepID=UPI002636669D|nr:PqiC family protein [Hydrogenophaga sp.]MDM7944128.1 PqiC family protein [Hydrogenophaga sp.]